MGFIIPSEYKQNNFNYKNRELKQEPIACDCWFTSTGKIMPRLFKFEDDYGVFHTVSNIHVNQYGLQWLAGIKVYVFSCSALNDTTGCEHHFTLYFHVEECKWKVSWN